MKFIKTQIKDLIIIEPSVFEDSRGYFLETYNKEKFDDFFCKIDFIQDNESKSSKGVLRGLHFQNLPYEQAKLVICINGKILDIVVDLRKSSKTYGKYVSVLLSGKRKRQLFIPRGFAHGFLVLSNNATFAYKVDNAYNKNSEQGIKWNDQDLNINWGIEDNDVIISEKDAELQLFNEFQSPF